MGPVRDESFVLFRICVLSSTIYFFCRFFLCNLLQIILEPRAFALSESLLRVGTPGLAPAHPGAPYLARPVAFTHARKPNNIHRHGTTSSVCFAAFSPIIYHTYIIPEPRAFALSESLLRVGTPGLAPAHTGTLPNPRCFHARTQAQQHPSPRHHFERVLIVIISRGVAVV